MDMGITSNRFSHYVSPFRTAKCFYLHLQQEVLLIGRYAIGNCFQAIPYNIISFLVENESFHQHQIRTGRVN